jgi:hypothetical protein
VLYTEKEPLTVIALDAAGHQTAMPAGVPTWAVSDATIATLTVAADGLSAELVGVHAGSVSVTVTLDGLTGSLSVTVSPGVPVSLQVVAGTPVAK